MRRALLVEDHEPSRKAYKEVMEKYQFTVAAPRHIEELRQLLDEFAYDFILTEVITGDGRPLDILAEYRDRLNRYGTIVVFMGRDPGLCNLIQAAGFQYFMLCPVSVEAVKHTIKRFFPNASSKSNKQ